MNSYNHYYYISLITFSVLLIVGREFKSGMSHVGIPMEIGYPDTIVVHRKSLLQRDYALETCVLISGSNHIGLM